MSASQPQYLPMTINQDYLERYSRELVAAGDYERLGLIWPGLTCTDYALMRKFGFVVHNNQLSINGDEV